MKKSLPPVNFSVVIPLHNEASMLKNTLLSIYKLKPKEVIFVLDRCTDSTEKIIEDFWKIQGSGKVKLVLLEVKEKSRWRKHLNFLYDLGVRNATSEVVLLSQADILHDYTTIRNNIHWGLHGMVSFAVLEHPHISPWNHFITKVLQTLGSFFGIHRFSGIIGMQKAHYLSCPLTSDDSLNFDTELKINFERKGFSYKFIRARNFHLRPWVRSKLWGVGVARYMSRRPFWKVLLFSIVRLTPKVIAGYLHARYLNNTNQGVEELK